MAKDQNKEKAPKVETKKVETPKVEAPKVETPKVETPKVEAPKVETPKKDISLVRIELMHPRLRAEVKRLFNYINNEILKGRAKVRITQTLRTNKEQNDLFALGRTAPGKIVTFARGGDSFHNYGLAFDICLIIDGKEASWDTKADYDKDGVADWMEVVQVFKVHGWTWGGDWKFSDMPHFQKTFGRTIADLKNITVKEEGIYPQLY